MANCRPYLDEQIEIVAPRTSSSHRGTCGASSFLGPKFSHHQDSAANGSKGPSGIPLISTFHPAYVLRQTGGELTAVKRLVWGDLKAVRTKLDERPEPTQEALVQPDLFGQRP